MWAVCVYIEAVSVLPQLRMMQKAKVVEKFTAHYVFALGVSRFVSCAHWILQIIDGDSFLLQAIGSGIWPAMVLLSEIVQTGILADFWCDMVAVCCAAARLLDCMTLLTFGPMWLLSGVLLRMKCCVSDCMVLLASGATWLLPACMMCSLSGCMVVLTYTLMHGGASACRLPGGVCYIHISPAMALGMLNSIHNSCNSSGHPMRHIWFSSLDCHLHYSQ